MPPKKASAKAIPLARGVTANVKLTAFTADMPGVWLNQLEAYLTNKCIVDRSLWFLHVSFDLSPHEKPQVRDLLEINPPPGDAYQQLKERLLYLYESDQMSRIHKLFKLPPLGGQRPSELLAQMRLLCY